MAMRPSDFPTDVQHNGIAMRPSDYESDVQHQNVMNKMQIISEIERVIHTCKQMLLCQKIITTITQITKQNKKQEHFILQVQEDDDEQSMYKQENDSDEETQYDKTSSQGSLVDQYDQTFKSDDSDDDDDVGDENSIGTSHGNDQTSTEQVVSFVDEPIHVNPPQPPRYDLRPRPLTSRRVSTKLSQYISKKEQQKRDVEDLIGNQIGASALVSKAEQNEQLIFDDMSQDCDLLQGMVIDYLFSKTKRKHMEMSNMDYSKILERMHENNKASKIQPAEKNQTKEEYITYKNTMRKNRQNNHYYKCIEDYTYKQFFIDANGKVQFPKLTMDPGGTDVIVGIGCFTVKQNFESMFVNHIPKDQYRAVATYICEAMANCIVRTILCNTFGLSVTARTNVTVFSQEMEHLLIGEKDKQLNRFIESEWDVFMTQFVMIGMVMDMFYANRFSIPVMYDVIQVLIKRPVLFSNQQAISKNLRFQFWRVDTSPFLEAYNSILRAQVMYQVIPVDKTTRKKLDSKKQV